MKKIKLHAVALLLAFSSVWGQNGGNALSLDYVTDSYATFPANASNNLDWDATSAWSISLWLYINDFDNTHTIFNKPGSGPGTMQIQFFEYPDVNGTLNGGGLAVHAEAQGGGWETPAYIPNLLTEHTWHHVVLTKNGNIIKFYVDGILANTINFTGSVTSATASTGNIHLGQQLASGLSSDMIIDEFAVWNQELTDVQIQEIMFKDLTGFASYNLESYYKFDQSSGTTILESNGNLGSNGTIQNATGNDWTQSSVFSGPKNALLFDGANNHITVPNSAGISWDINSNFTISHWVKFNSFATTQFLWHKKSSNNSELTAALYYHPTNKLTFRYIANNAWNYNSNGKDVFNDPNKWYNVAFVKNGLDVSIYVDGDIYYQTTMVNSGQTASTGLFYIGIDEIGNHLNGYMDEFHIWNRALTQSEIIEYSHKTLVGNETDLEAYYRFDQSSGTGGSTVLYDRTSNGHNGTLNNFDVNNDWVTSSAFNTWLGFTSSDWATASNWSAGVPAATDNIGVYNFDNNLTISGNPTVSNIIFGNSAGYTFSSGITVTGVAALTNTNIDLNSQTVTLDGVDARVAENSGFIFTNGTLTSTVPLNAPSSVNPGNLGAVITSASNLGNTSITRTHNAETIGAASPSIQRNYLITPTTNTGLNATLQFNYDDDELNGNTESQLQLVRYNGSSWENYGGTTNTSNNTITQTTIDAFSSWTAVAVAPLVAASNLAPNGLSNVDENAVTLTWDASTGGISNLGYVINVYTVPSGGIPVYTSSSQSGTSFDLSANYSMNNNTVYYWEVETTDAIGTEITSSRVGFRTYLAQPVLSYPGNGNSISELDPTFNWDDINGADDYLLEVNTNNTFSGNSLYSGLIGSSSSEFTINAVQNGFALEDGQTYYWRVTAKNSGTSNTSLVSNVSSFSTGIQTLTSPSDGAYSISINPTLTWPSITGADEYLLEIDTDSNFGTASSYTETTNSKELTGLANNTTYHWRVTARNTRSAASSFTTHLATPNLTAPVNNAVNQPLNPTFTWDAVPGADNYEIEVNTASDFSGTDIFTNTNLGNVTTFTLDDPTNTIQDNQTFYWRLRAKNAATNTSLFSDTLSFSTIKQTLVVTTDEQTLVAINPTLEWTPVAGADNYRLEVNTAANFSGTVIFDNTVAGTSQQIGPLVYNTRYYWRVTASNLRSDVWSFVTILDTPVLDAPADNAILNTFTPTFTWTMNPNISNVEHELLLNTTDGTVSPADVNNITVVNPGSLSIQPAAPLNPATKYFWSINSRVNDGTALNDGEEKQSTERAFFTPLEITWPIIGLTGVAIEPTFEWTETNFEDYYELRISTQGGSQIAFDANVIFTDLNIPQDTDSIRYTWATEDDANPGTFPFPLNNSTKYYWQLKAHDNVSGVTLSSPIWHFTTFPHKTVFAWNPANGFESTTTNVTFTWSLNQGTGGLKFRLQVKASNTVPTETDWLTAEYDTTETSLSRTLQLAGGTKYYWRVLVLNDDEEVVTHSSVFYFTTKGGAVTPYPSWPVGNPTVYTNAPTLYWYLMGASTDLTFDIEVDQDQSGIADYSATNINGLFHTVGVNLLPGTQYSWRVRSVYKRGTPDEEIASWSSWNSFTTNGTGTLVVPTPSYPTGGLLVYNTTIQPYWYLGASGAGLVYDVQLSTTSDFSAGVTNYTDVASYANATFNLSPGETYYWRVRSDNGTTTSAWSSTAVFTVFGGSTYSYVYANWPIGGVTVYSNTPTLSWYLDGSRANFSKYHVKWKAGSNSSDWSSDFDGQADILDPNTTTYTFGTGLTYGETYYWGVAAVYNGTDYTDWAEGSFKVVGGASAGEPILSYPFDGTLIFGTDVTLSWYLNGSSAGIQGYEVVYSNSDVFAPAATNTIGPNGQTSSSVSVSGLTVGATYYWKVRSWYGGSTYSNYSATYSFVINSSTNSPLQPKIGGPTNNIIVNSANPTLSWVITSQPVSGLTYELEIADNVEMNDAVLVDEISASFYESAESLERDKNYFWRVRSKTEDGTYSYYSGIGKFKVGDNVTSVEELLIPDKFTVEQNYPNPFNPTTIIKFGLPEQTAVSVKIYNMLGQEVKTLLNDVRNAGTYNLQWNGDDNFGNKVASGAYIYRIVAGKDVATKKMILIK